MKPIRHTISNDAQRHSQTADTGKVVKLPKNDLLAELNRLLATLEGSGAHTELDGRELRFKKAEASALLKLLKANKHLEILDLSSSIWPASQLIKLGRVIRALPELKLLHLDEFIIENFNRYYIYYADTRTMDDVEASPHEETVIHKGSFHDDLCTAWGDLVDFQQILASRADEPSNITAYEAARLQLWPQLTEMIQQEGPIDTRAHKGPFAGCSALWWAAWYDETAMVERLLATGEVDLFARAEEGKFEGLNIPLLALLKNNNNLFDACMDDAINQDEFDFDSSWFDPKSGQLQSILYLCVMRKNYMHFGFLWASGNFDASMKPEGQAPTLLWLLAKDKQWDLCRRLLQDKYSALDYFPLERGPDQFKTAVWWAAKAEQWELVALFIKRGAGQLYLSPIGELSVRALARAGQHAEVNQLLAKPMSTQSVKKVSKLREHEFNIENLLSSVPRPEGVELAKKLMRAAQAHKKLVKSAKVHHDSIPELEFDIKSLASIRDNLLSKLAESEKLAQVLSQSSTVDKKALQKLKTLDPIKQYLNPKSQSKKDSYQSDVRALDAGLLHFKALVESEKENLPSLNQYFSMTVELEQALDDNIYRNDELFAERAALKLNIDLIYQHLEDKMQAIEDQIAAQNAMISQYRLLKPKPPVGKPSSDTALTRTNPVALSDALDRFTDEPLRTQLQTILQDLKNVSIARTPKASAIKFACGRCIDRLGQDPRFKAGLLHQRWLDFIARGGWFLASGNENDTLWKQFFEALMTVKPEDVAQEADLQKLSATLLCRVSAPSLSDIKAQLHDTFDELLKLSELAQAKQPIAQPWMHFALAFNLIRFFDNYKRLMRPHFAPLLSQLKANEAVNNLWSELLARYEELKLQSASMPIPTATAQAVLNKNRQQYVILIRAIDELKYPARDRHPSPSVYAIDEPFGLAELFAESPSKRPLNSKAPIFVPRAVTNERVAVAKDDAIEQAPAVPANTHKSLTQRSAPAMDKSRYAFAQTDGADMRQLRFLSIFSPRKLNPAGQYGSPFALPFRGFRFEVAASETQAPSGDQSRPQTK